MSFVARFARTVFGLAALLAWSCRAADAPAPAPLPGLPEGARVLLNIAYVTNGGDSQKLDLYLPSDATNCPLIVWIHGGAWLEGSKEKPPGFGFVRHGFALASINYRLS